MLATNRLGSHHRCRHSSSHTHTSHIPIMVDMDMVDMVDMVDMDMVDMVDMDQPPRATPWLQILILAHSHIPNVNLARYQEFFFFSI